MATKSKQELGLVFYECPTCGRYELTSEALASFDPNKAGSYLFYKRFETKDSLLRYHTTLDKEYCDTWRNKADNGNTRHGRPVHMDKDMIESWHPKTFSERVEAILIKVSELSHHYGELIRLSEKESNALFFIEQKEYVDNPFQDGFNQWVMRKGTGLEKRYIIDYLNEEGLITIIGSLSTNDLSLRLTPKGYSRVEEMQKNHLHGKDAFVAMQFGEETRLLREKIREGITEAGYNAVLIDEVHHNNFIAPEIMRHIRDCKFVVVDLTHQNNGAYFEEGYAMGVGKPVIQLCKKDMKLHFDIAQKNTIIWETEDGIPERLSNRIKATID